VCLTFEGLAKNRGIDFKVIIPDEEIFIKSDKRSLTQILMNLINNALKFTEKGSVSIELELKETRNKSVAIIHVRDTGLGIKKEDTEKLFKAFEQISTPGKLAEGTGLGLHLCKKFAGLIQAKINFESEFGRGSHFYVTIPVLQVVKKKEIHLEGTE
jgi:protein-histidine pros-kinase